MILSDTEIKEALKNKEIVITPTPNDDQYDTTALNLRLSDEFIEWNPAIFGPKSAEVRIDFTDAKLKEFHGYIRNLDKESDGSIILKPGRFVIAKTLERIRLPRESQIAARIEGRSTAARLGFVVHLSAPTIHLGFEGTITLEIINFGPFHIKLDPKRDQICQLIFERVSGPTSAPPSQYQGQTDAIGK